MRDYYMAYEDRYRKTYETDELWEKDIPTREVLEVIKKYGINKNNQILDLGCGEGRDARYLLSCEYNVLAIDYSISAINKCNLLTNNKYIDNFRQFDLILDNMDNKFDFIYSIAVIHMFLLDSHRDAFYKFIYDHLNDNGISLIIAMGDGNYEYSSDINDAFLEKERVNVNSKNILHVASTSCNIKSINNMIIEIEKNNLEIIEKRIINDLPSFDACEYFVVRKKR